MAACSYSRLSHDGTQGRVRICLPGLDRIRHGLRSNRVSNRNNRRDRNRGGEDMAFSGRMSHGSGGMAPPGLTEEVRSESLSPRSSVGEVPQIPARRSEGRRFSALGQSARRSRVRREASHDSPASPLPEGGPSQTTIACALMEASRSSDRGGSPCRDHSGWIRAGRRSCRAREGERSQLIRGAAYANGLAAVWGDSFHGMDRKETRASPNAPPAAP